ncbi:tyrosine-protein kinase hopscotch [Achroia grisella]|uniref:tyrosine-protein kinase hopscotch n=1 Tax=Achroia grisella TaxID=688607 RepID=UPI0027D22610|nr:tyrosine-protein kinase hopscotch [Achroia grisella]
MASFVENVTVSVVTNNNIDIIHCSENFTAEELCIQLCNKYNIPPLTRALFALRVKGTNYFLNANSEVLQGSRDYELRIRFMVPKSNLNRLLDEKTFDYYFQQARNDINENKVPEIKYPEYKEQLLGLGITEMCRAKTEENLSLTDVIRNRKKYIPKIIMKKHGPFPKKRANTHVPILCRQGYTVHHFKTCYLEQLYTLAPNYLAEEFHNVLLQNGDDVVHVLVVVAPFHQQYPGIRYYNTASRECVHVCIIDDLIYLMRKEDLSLEVSRKGTPLYFKFKTEEQLSSFISICDGYYRLMVKWTFNLSKDDETPSLKELYRLKCHGPVGGAFSYRKLQVKCSNKHGCYLLRQCHEEYNVFYLDACNKNSTPETYKIEFKGHGYIFLNKEYPSIESIISQHKVSKGRIFLNECLPPSEYDESQVLLCSKPERQGVHIDQSELSEALKTNRSPRCLLNKDIHLYIGSEKFGAGNLTMTCKAIWKIDETKKLIVAFKALQKDEQLKGFMNLASKYVNIQSSSIVRLYGMTFNSPTALVLEYMPYGPLNEYLKSNVGKVKATELLKVSASVARALWDLSEAGVVHGRLRCRRLLLAAAAPDRLIVKLAGPSLRPYTADDVHWMPIEFFDDMNLAKRSVVGDIWAFATTIWEVFSNGLSPLETNPVMTAISYKRGNRLMQPRCCPPEVWTLVLQCWQSSPLRPQEIMRDLNHMLYREDANIHEYELPKVTNNIAMNTVIASDKYNCNDQSDAGSNQSLISNGSTIFMNGGTMRQPNGNRLAVGITNEDVSSVPREPLEFPVELKVSEDDWHHDKPLPMQAIESHGTTYLVSCKGKIGGGSYGVVFKGIMFSEDDNSELQTTVAVKKLTPQKSGANLNAYADFENELKIMKCLKHDNIVKILGYSWDDQTPDPTVFIVMEYLEESSLNNYLKFQGDKLSISHLLKYATDISTGMEYISSKKIVHRDLATRNILVVDRGHVKISDFGLARSIPGMDVYQLKTERLLPFNWYAPESTTPPFLFSTKSDVWSYGVTMWEIFTRVRQEVPKFDVDRPRERASCFQKPSDCPLEIYRRLMTNCWDLDPQRRPNFTDLKQTCQTFLIEYKQISD